VLRIRDHGVGIPREMREAFERSGRIQSRPGTMNEEGTGFGMMLMRDFTKAMRGEFRLESRTAEESAADHGTTIEIRLPVAVTADHLTTP
jgi:signal transduction histidine kinase